MRGVSTGCVMPLTSTTDACVPEVAPLARTGSSRAAALEEAVAETAEARRGVARRPEPRPRRGPCGPKVAAAAVVAEGRASNAQCAGLHLPGWGLRRWSSRRLILYQ